jgi:hypothetical protein
MKGSYFEYVTELKICNLQCWQKWFTLYISLESFTFCWRMPRASQYCILSCKFFSLCHTETNHPVNLLIRKDPDRVFDHMPWAVACTHISFRQDAFKRWNIRFIYQIIKYYIFVPTSLKFNNMVLIPVCYKIYLHDAVSARIAQAVYK